MCERLFSDRKGKNSLFTNEEPPTPLLFQPPLLLIYTKVSNPPTIPVPPIIRNLRVKRN